jgi:hypothetical protein
MQKKIGRRKIKKSEEKNKTKETRRQWQNMNNIEEK